MQISDIKYADSIAAKSVQRTIAAHREGQEIDISTLAQQLWVALYDQVPTLTASKHRDDQHKILENYLVQLGLPENPGLQWIAGPAIWYAREKHVLPPAQGNGHNPEPWQMDESLYEKLRGKLDEGFVFYSDWVTSALKDVLSSQR